MYASFIRRAALSLPIACALVNASCAFVKLRENVERIERFATVSGTVEGGMRGTATVVVLLNADTDAQIDSFIVGARGKYYFVVPPGAYRIAAFTDAVPDFRYDPAKERGVWYGAPDTLRLGVGETRSDTDITVAASDAVVVTQALAAPDPGNREMHGLPDVNVGTVAPIDDPRFTPENGDLGMWQPLDFALAELAGIYFLEPYSPDKTPVLFVHGMAGNPSDFAQLIAHLDRRHFQPWLLYYPSGARVDSIGRAALRWLTMLVAQHRSPHVIVVAHSMGGLVARSMIDQWVKNTGAQRVVKLDLFVTLSTPWGGHAAAESGVEHAPVVVPAWNDMAPGSEFLRGLFATKLPEECRYYLLFGFEGGSMLLDGVNDGVVAVASELAPVAQEEAVKIYGFPESHMGILRSKDASERLNRILAESRK